MKKIILILTTLFLLTGCSGVYKEQGANDAANFKTTYEQESNIEVDANNKIVYLTFTEVKELLSSETGILFLGTPKNTYTTELVPSLIEVTNTINTNVYYIDTNNLEETEKTELIELLSDYTITVNGEKQVSIPLLLFIKKGDVVDYFNGHENQIIKNKNYDLLKSTILDKYRKLQ